MEEQNNTNHSFYQRFNIEVGLEEAQERFINRVMSDITSNFGQLGTVTREPWDVEVVRKVAYRLGISFRDNDFFSEYIPDYLACLHAIEALYAAFKTSDYYNDGSPEAVINEIVKSAITASEVDLEIEWKDGIFSKSGAKLLDESLINANLKWLSSPSYADVLTPFKKGLSHFLEAQKQPEKFSSTITDMYEAMEKMTRITNKNNKTLGANAEEFINNLGLSEHYKIMLGAYTKYAHEFRHAVKQGEERKPPLPNEVEAFVYTTGLFIRLAIQQLNQ